MEKATILHSPKLTIGFMHLFVIGMPLQQTMSSMPLLPLTSKLTAFSQMLFGLGQKLKSSLVRPMAKVQESLPLLILLLRANLFLSILA